MSYALILIFALTAGGVETVDPGYSFASLDQCTQAAGVARSYISLRKGQKSLVVQCRAKP